MVTDPSSPAFNPLLPSKAGADVVGFGVLALLFAPVGGFEPATKGVALIAKSSLAVPLFSLSRNLLARDRSRYSLMEPTRSSSMSFNTGESFSRICLITYDEAGEK